MTLQLFIARHGQNEDNANGILNGHRDLPLTELGREQAHHLAKAIQDANMKFDAIYASPLSRAMETAKIVANTIGGPSPVAYSDLIERDFGSMTGRKIAEVEMLCAPDIMKTETITYFLNPRGAETFPELVDRGKRILSHFHETYSSERVLLVCHGDIGKMIYAAATGRPWREVLADFHFGNAELIEVDDNGTPYLVRLEQHNA